MSLNIPNVLLSAMRTRGGLGLAMASSCLAQFCSTCRGREAYFLDAYYKTESWKIYEFYKLISTLFLYFLPVVGFLNNICNFSCSYVLFFYHLAIHTAASFLSLDRPRILPGKRQQCLCQLPSVSSVESTAAVRAYPAKMENKPTWEQSEVTFLRRVTQPASQRMGVGPSTASLLP